MSKEEYSEQIANRIIEDFNSDYPELLNLEQNERLRKYISDAVFVLMNANKIFC